MGKISELTKDKSFRLGLILACLGVAAFVSIIYVIVSYRITAELVLNTELKAIEKQAHFLHSELAQRDSSASLNIEDFASKIYPDGEESSSVYIKASNSKGVWTFSQNVSPIAEIEVQEHLSKGERQASGVFEVADKSFLWLKFEGSVYTLDIVQSADALDRSMVLVTKRLSIVSLIVFWIAVWLALTLSSLIAKRVQQKNDALAEIATHDALTGLPNRLFLDELLSEIAADNGNVQSNAANSTSINGCLFVIDLDKFKEVNDSFGHSAGDRLLIELASRLDDTLIDDQVLMRVGGDEFVIWTPLLQISEAKILAKKLVDLCDIPVMINNLAVNTGASIGIAHYPSHADTGDTLLISADTAMYKAKQQRCGWALYDERDSVDFTMRIRLRADLAKALENHEIKLYYQTKVDLSTGKIIGVEALARWYHPEDGVLAPNMFIDIIEQSGRMQEFGRYVIAQAISQLSTWQKVGIDIPIAVNLSPYNLLDPGLVSFISKTLTDNKVSANNLEIELTENETSLNIKSIQHSLESIKALGVKLAIDDFGTGMSSLAYIANLDVDIIKIDRSFVTDIKTNSKHLAIISSALTLSKSFGCKMVAEGVEHQEQADILLQMGCHYAQGYLFSKPMTADAIGGAMTNDKLY